MELQALPHLRLYRQRVMLPLDKRAPSMYSLVFLNTADKEGIVPLIKQKNLFDSNKIRTYYLPRVYATPIFGRANRLVLPGNTEDDYYKPTTDALDMYQLIWRLNTSSSRNMYVDMHIMNRVFFDIANKQTRPYLAKAEEYLRYMQVQIDGGDMYETYRNRTMVINIDEWRKPRPEFNQKSSLDNPIYYMYLMLLREHETFMSIFEHTDINIVFKSGESLIRLNPKEITKQSHVMFKRELEKVDLNVKEVTEEEELEQEEIKSRLAQGVLARYNLTGNKSTFEKEVVKIVDKEVVKKEKATPDADVGTVTAEINDDEEVVKAVMTLSQNRKTGSQLAMSKRDEELRQKQFALKVGNTTVEELLKKDPDETSIEVRDIAHKVATTNKNMTKITFPNFEKSYNKKLLKKDMVNVITQLNDAGIPAYVRDIKIEDSSNELNFKETVTVQLEDANRVRHTLKFDMPKFIDDKFMYLNGNTKMIVKQLMMKPVVKTGPTTVQICSNYNKIFMTRYGQKVSSKIEKLRKTLALNNFKGVTIKFGSSVATNNKYRTTIEYDEISRSITQLSFGKTVLMFNQDAVKEAYAKWNEGNATVPDGQMCFGFTDGKPLYISLDDQLIHTGGEKIDLVDYILRAHNGVFATAYDEQKAGRKFLYTRAKVMSKDVPIVLLLCYLEGLSGLLRKAGITHRFSDTRPRVDDTEGVVQFANGFLVYNKYPFENSLLMNAFADIPTKAFEYEQFDDREVYLEIFETMFGRRNIGTAFDNFRDFMIDPMTKEVLEDLNLPTNFTEVVLYANALLVDNAYKLENDMSLYRVRSNEVINGHLHKQIATAYSQYRTTAMNNNPRKISIRKDAVLKDLLMSPTVEDYSILNPIVELEKSRAITPKGLSGLNVSSAYTQDKRSYDKTMMGVLAMSTSPDANCGIVRQLTMEPNIISTRGYIDVNDGDLDALTDTKLFSPAELMSPLGASRDDTIRTAMATKQSKHIIPIKNASPVLISNGAEQSIHYHLGDDFSVVAKYDGIVREINEDTGIVVIEYTAKKGELVDESGQVVDTLFKAININPRTVKNGAGGFYLSNKLSFELKVGQKFKQDDVLAWDKNFFSHSPLNGNRFNIGSLQKVAVIGGYATYEDSTFITKKLSRDMTSELVMQKSVVLGKNSNLDYIVKVGDQVKVGDELIRFEMSFEDESLNKFLSNVGDDLKEEIRSLGKTPIKSKYTGVIEDIKVYSTIDLDEMSPSLRRFVSGHYAKINKKHAQLNKYDKSEASYKMGMLLNEPTRKLESPDGKIKGVEVGEGVIIEIYIKYVDTMSVGDKLAFFTALKSIIGEVIPEGLEPFSLSDPDEEISSVIAPGAVLARMTPSILLTMFGNKVLVNLKRQLQEMYTGKPYEHKK